MKKWQFQWEGRESGVVDTDDKFSVGCSVKKTDDGFAWQVLFLAKRLLRY